MSQVGLGRTDAVPEQRSQREQRALGRELSFFKGCDSLVLALLNTSWEGAFAPPGSNPEPHNQGRTGAALVMMLVKTDIHDEE